jgi:hypothetical protein
VENIVIEDSVIFKHLCAKRENLIAQVSQLHQELDLLNSAIKAYFEGMLNVDLPLIEQVILVIRFLKKPTVG